MKKRIIISHIATFTLVIVVFVISIRNNWFIKVGNRIEAYREAQKQEEEYNYRNNELEKAYEIPALIDEPDAWYTKYHFISHAGGGIDGKAYTNSLEAWELSYSRGNRLFDADMSYTEDGVLVLRHSWDDNLEINSSIRGGKEPRIDRNGQIRLHMNRTEVLKYEQFKATKIYKKYSPMTCQDMLEFMSTHSDVYVMCDMKEDLSSAYSQLITAAQDMGYEEVADRIIVSIYGFEDVEKVRKIYPFENVIIRQYINQPHNYKELINMCYENDIHAVSISACYVDDEGIKALVEHNIHTYVAICDYISDMREYQKLGINGAVTNYLYEEDWNLVTDNN